MWGRDFETGDGKYKNPKYIHTTRRGNCKDFGCYEQNLEEKFLSGSVSPLYNSTRKHEDSREVPL